MDLVHQFLDFFRRNISGVLAGILKKAADDGRIRTGPQVKEAYLPQVVSFDQPDWNLMVSLKWAIFSVGA